MASAHVTTSYSRNQGEVQQRLTNSALFRAGRAMTQLTRYDILALREVRDPREQREIEAGYYAATGQLIDDVRLSDEDAREFGLEFCLD
jgi:hypothetical protein